MKTALYAQHLQANAQMVSFFGWSMPMNYGSQIEEHMAVRQKAGVFDVSHMMITDISGDSSEAFLRKLLTCDVAKLTFLSGISEAKYCLLLNEQGGIIDDLIVYKMQYGFRIVSNCGTRANVYNWLQAQQTALNMHDIALHQADKLSIIAVQGPDARQQSLKALAKVLDKPDLAIAENLQPFTSTMIADNIMLSASGYTGEAGYEIILPNDLAPQLWERLVAKGAQPCGLGARDTLRLESGMSLYGQDMDETTTPQASRLTWTLDTSDPDRDFIGQKALAHQTNNYVLKPFVLNDKAIPRHGQKLFDAETERNYGEVTSGSFSPSLQMGIGYARIQKGAPQTIMIGIRKKRHHVVFIQGAFFKNGQKTF